MLMLDTESTDPLSPSANQGAILTPASSAAVSLMMGVEVVAPPASLANDIFPAFNIEDAMKYSVYGAQQPDDTIKLPNPTVQSKYIPANADATTVATEVGSSVPKVRAEAVLEVWERPPSVDPAGLVKDWVTFMGWSAGSIVGCKPQRAIDSFADTYAGAPWIAVC
jgi:hypothetical protein